MEKDLFDQQVDIERIRQDRKWGEQNHRPSIWFAIMMEEAGELSATIIAGEWKPLMQKRSVTDMEKELIHIVAVAKAMWESGKRNGWL